jgi:hypothetical protein
MEIATDDAWAQPLAPYTRWLDHEMAWLVVEADS